MDSTDHDTVAAILTRWKADGAGLPAVLDRPPQSGRLKSPQPEAYAHVESALDRTEQVGAGTGAPWFDYRDVTITVRGPKAKVVAAVRAVLAVFTPDVTLAYPSGARFMAWRPQGDRLEQEQGLRKGEDVWAGVVTAKVWSTRTY